VKVKHARTTHVNPLGANFLLPTRAFPFPNVPVGEEQHRNNSNSNNTIPYHILACFLNSSTPRFHHPYLDVSQPWLHNYHGHWRTYSHPTPPPSC
jgi:hypothetical protein